MDVPWQGITTDWTSMNSSRGHYADILVMVSYLLLVLGVGLWVREGPEGRAGPWTPGWR